MATRHVVRSWRAGRVNRLKEKVARSKLMDTERASAEASGSRRTIVASLAALGSVVLASSCCFADVSIHLCRRGRRKFCFFFQALGLSCDVSSLNRFCFLSEMASEKVPMQTDFA